jgi:hypothetical protein
MRILAILALLSLGACSGFAPSNFYEGTNSHWSVTQAGDGGGSAGGSDSGEGCGDR